MRAGQVRISGHAEPGFVGVADAFAANFAHRNELGATCCIYVGGEKVVDLWGGIRDRRTGEPWEEDTMVCVFSATKGMSGLALALAHSRGLLDYDERVAHPSLLRTVRRRSPSGSCCRTRRACSPSMLRLTGPCSPILTGWRLYSPSRSHCK